MHTANLTELNRQYNEQIDKIEDQLNLKDHELEKLEREVTERKSELLVAKVDADNAMEQYNVDLQKIMSDKELIQASIDTMNEQHQAQLKKSNFETNKANFETSRAKDETKKATAETTKVKTELVNTQAELSDLQGQIHNLQTEKTRIEEEKRKLQEKLNTAVRILKESDTKIGEKEAVVRNLENELGKTEHYLLKIKTELKVLTERHKNLTISNAELKTDKDNLETETENLKYTVNQSKINAFQTYISSGNKQVTYTERKKQHTTTMLDLLKAFVADNKLDIPVRSSTTLVNRYIQRYNEEHNIQPRSEPSYALHVIYAYLRRRYKVDLSGYVSDADFTEYQATQEAGTKRLEQQKEAKIQPKTVSSSDPVESTDVGASSNDEQDNTAGRFKASRNAQRVESGSENDEAGPVSVSKKNLLTGPKSTGVEIMQLSDDEVLLTDTELLTDAEFAKLEKEDKKRKAKEKKRLALTPKLDDTLEIEGNKQNLDQEGLGTGDIPGGLSNYQIDAMMKKYPGFIGCFSIDQMHLMKPRSRTFSFILNTQSHTVKIRVQSNLRC